MKNALHAIRKKVNDIGFGILRFRGNERDTQDSYQVSSKFDGDSSVQCFVNTRADMREMQNGMVSFIQKLEDDYLYIAGHVEEISPATGGCMVWVRVLKASWFVRRSKGTLSWLQEKHVYMPGGEKLQMVS